MFSLIYYSHILCSDEKMIIDSCKAEVVEDTNLNLPWQVDIVFVFLEIVDLIISFYLIMGKWARYLKQQGPWICAKWPGINPRCWRGADFSSLLHI